MIIRPPSGVIMRPTHADLTRFVNDNHSAASRIGFSVLALKEIWAMATGVRFNCSKNDNCRLGNSYLYEFHSVGNYTPKSKRWFRERVVVQSVFVKGLNELDSFELDRAGLVSGGRWGISAKRKKSGRLLTVSCRDGFAIISSDSVLFKNSLNGGLQETGSSAEFRSLMSDLFQILEDRDDYKHQSRIKYTRQKEWSRFDLRSDYAFTVPTDEQIRRARNIYSRRRRDLLERDEMSREQRFEKMYG
jgi:hypothetical protein